MERSTLQADVGNCGICKQKSGGGRGAGIAFTPPSTPTQRKTVKFLENCAIGQLIIKS